MLLIGLAILVTSIAIGIMAMPKEEGGSQAGLVWGGANFVCASLLTLILKLIESHVFPAWLMPPESIFDKQLTPGAMVLSFFLQKFFDFGSVTAVTVFFFFLACFGKPKASGSRFAPRNIDWKSRIR